MEFFTYRLPNGIRGIHRQVKSNVAHCALAVSYTHLTLPTIA